MKVKQTANLLAVLSLATTVFSFTPDYVIIGGGTAGLTVAGRLSENPHVNVLVIESGLFVEDQPNVRFNSLRQVFVPGLTGTNSSNLTWGYKTTPQVNLNNRTLTVNAGKALGGSTIINSMIFTRGISQQYDVWGTLNNDNTWSWDGLLPYFKKSEIFTPPTAEQVANGGMQFDPSFHGFNGSVKVGYPNFYFPASTLWRESVINLGWNASPDLTNGAPQHSVGVSPDSLDAANNTRCSAACAFYVPNIHRPNLQVILNATVTRITWKPQRPGQNLTAQGVEYVQNGVTHTVPVNKEVIVSAGTIGSPKVLELSGVGNSSIIAGAGVKPVLSLPSVGENLIDHIHGWANAITNLTLSKDLLVQNQTFSNEQLALWFENRTGITLPSDVFNTSELQTLLSQANQTLSQTAEEFSNGNPALAKGLLAILEQTLNLYEQDETGTLEISAGPTPASNRPVTKYTAVNAVLYAPLSRGRTHITSSDVSIPPAVNPNYYAHPFDSVAHTAGVQLARRILQTAPLLSSFVQEFEPGVTRPTDEDVEEWLRANASSDNHPVGTASMLPSSLGGVVDTKLRVYGISNVRVVDASIIPMIVSSHLAADMIINQS
ncbi:hypothetical protein Clacol_008645 [Clathrus columnatus]|uniref:Glucose-methanol-choline oxidoreductase N-terminal domain-containing protein n=1 Tax=Clathrus columnatus TaxID=1419009 RepID=A0AAV5ANC0_9AGAM|nr:hypothetical protein Clacol_008645 [Clathrus columnatus]